MGFSLGHLFKACLLFVNAVAVLNEDRFLARIGWGTRSVQVGAGPNLTAGDDAFGLNSQDTKSPGPLKLQIIRLIASVQTLLKFPLIILNVVWIAFELAFG
ncbi:hypothetical protein H696_03145 [Fonticula alba]|uniref:Yos1-like protein n=1 Tax=Fonticula alba TaxID=691883 RepID=A0A058Z900_FONAL|nr:hypothetical protein H696_03145 [Fonticula alba]KCV70794.1 hypothetical protein H696_03145 [Fonticula alba]|eukprot:XP_009495310.1 hypothetical protein H696_03145 [Fonticula alba]